MPDAERVDQLLADLMDHHADGPCVSSFGDTGYDPAVDFPVCRRAVEELVAMGEGVVPRLLEVIASGSDEQAFFVAEVLGRLRAAEAIEPLDRLVRSRAASSRRVNFDQFIEYPVYRQAFDALWRIDPARARGALESLTETNDQGTQWAKDRLAELRAGEQGVASHP